MKMAVLSSAVIRLENAMKTTISMLCDEIGKIVEDYSVKELQNVLPIIIDSLFELGLQQPSWSLRTLTKSVHSHDFEAIRHLLSPRGPIFALCYKLLNDSTLKYEFPLNYIPVAVRQVLEEGVVPSFYVGKLQYHSQLRIPSSLALNSFEYYLMHFLYYLVNPNLQKYITITAGSDSVYFAVLEDYLLYFLPCTGTEPDFISVPSQLGHFGSPVFSTPPPKPKFESARSSMTPSLLKKSALTPTSASGSTSMSTDRCSSSHQSDSCWRTMFLLQAINELWLSHVTSRENCNLQRAGSPSRSQTISVLQSAVFLPTLDHLRGVRTVVKHLHYFANSGGPNIITGMDELKRSIWTYFQKKLYIFLRHTLEHWPLDASFRLFLETWLSYIQPWRYVSTANAVKIAGENGDKVVDFKWQAFVAENLLFFTHFFRKVMTRFLRVELSSSKTSLMLYRISKVYSQRNLREMVAAAESSLTECSGGFSKSVSCSSNMGASVRQFIHELEGPSFQYVPLFDSETFLVIRNVLSAAAQAKANLRSSQVQSMTKDVSNLGFWTRLVRWLGTSGSVSGEENGEEIRKTLNHLETASIQIANFFELEVPVEPEPEQVFSGTSAAFGVTSGLTAVSSTRRPSLISSGMMDSSFMSATLSPRKRYDLKYRGNPDTQPIRSYEIAFLVRIFHQISSMINEKFGADLEEMYHRNDFSGRVFRQLLAPPTEYQEVTKYFGTPRVVEKRLPARIRLRILAHKQIVGGVLAVFLASWGIGWSPEILALLLLSAALAVLFVRASLATYRERNGNISIEIDDSSFVSPN